MTHDEIISLTPAPEADFWTNIMLSIMKDPPEWCADLPVNAEGGNAINYSK